MLLLYPVIALELMKDGNFPKQKLDRDEKIHVSVVSSMFRIRLDEENTPRDTR